MLVPPEFFKLGPVVARLSEFSSSPEALLVFFCRNTVGLIGEKLTMTICRS